MEDWLPRALHLAMSCQISNTSVTTSGSTQRCDGYQTIKCPVRGRDTNGGRVCNGKVVWTLLNPQIDVGLGSVGWQTASWLSYVCTTQSSRKAEAYHYRRGYETDSPKDAVCPGSLQQIVLRKRTWGIRQQPIFRDSTPPFHFLSASHHSAGREKKRKKCKEHAAANLGADTAKFFQGLGHKSGDRQGSRYVSKHRVGVNGSGATWTPRITYRIT